jgi:hypothetical protein
MKGKFLRETNDPFTLGNIYADKSSLILNWLLREGIDKNGFSLRAIAQKNPVSLGLVQKVCKNLLHHGLLQTKGVRTAKRFFLKKPELLLKSWLDPYSILKKCKIRTYRSGFNRDGMLQELKHSGLYKKTVLALHSAAEAHRCKNTNLQTLELYMLDPKIRPKIEATLQLEPQERGYEVLLIEPYYKSLLQLAENAHEEILYSPPLLTFLDLYHFPLRGHEQAEFMAQRLPELKRIYK